jgi:hypothetical protein
VLADVFNHIYRTLSDLRSVFALSHTCVQLFVLSLDDKNWRYYFTHWDNSLKRPYPLLQGLKDDSVWKWRVLIQNYLRALMGCYTGKCYSFCCALYEFEAEETDEVSFNEEDILAVTQQGPDGWWTAMNLMAETPNVVGLIPCNYVQEYFVHTTGHAQHVPLYDAKFRANCDHQAVEEDELTYGKGDLFVAKHDHNGWYEVVDQHGKWGFVLSHKLTHV